MYQCNHVSNTGWSLTPFLKIIVFFWWELPNTKKIEEYLRNSGNIVKLKNLFKK